MNDITAGDIIHPSQYCSPFREECGDARAFLHLIKKQYFIDNLQKLPLGMILRGYLHPYLNHVRQN